ncbi:MAG: EAL domain-containing protein [Gammaproteobacteria bacterium]|nr:EAL domain-containing protein [Gammaproteobacteria bacterium]
MMEYDALFREVFESSEDAVFILDDDTLIDCNPAAVRMLGCASKDELLPAFPWGLSPSMQPDGRSSPEKAEEMIRIAHERNFHRFEWIHTRASGEEFPVEVTLTPVSLEGKRVLHVVWRDLTEQKRAEQKLRENEERFRNVARVTTDVIWDWDLHTDTVWWSEGMQQQFGYLPEELEPDSSFWTQRIHPDDRDRVTTGIYDLINGNGTEWRDEYRFVCHDGSIAEIMDWGIVIRDDAGKALRMVGGMIDVTEQRHYELQLRQAAHVLASTREGVTITDLDKHILSVNQAFTDITGYTEEEVLGKTPAVLSSGYHGKSFYEAMWRSIMETGHWQGEIWNRRKSGEIYPEWLTISAVHDDQGNITNYVGVFSDISHIKQSESKLERLKHYDPLTELPNRELFMTLLQQGIARMSRRRGRLSLLYCDIDRFKPINDGLGHRAGDQVLQQMAKRLRGRLRAEDILARLSADEFVVIIESLEDHDAAGHLAQDIVRLADEPVALDDGNEVRVGMSVGIAMFPEDGVNPETLLQSADNAMNQAKPMQHEHFSYYTPGLTELAQERMQLEADLRHALEQGQLMVYFQPLLSVSNGTIKGAEALARWRHPEQGMIPPDRFIPLAEESGLIGQLGEQVMRQACTTVAGWHENGYGKLRLAINFSANQLLDPHLVDKMAAILADTGFDPEYLEMELTESILMLQGDRSLKALQDIGALGVRLAIDDFGTGYSSLAYLQEIAADTLKIDRRFISNMTQDLQSAQIASTIIAMGRNLGMEIVAEGVETAEQLNYLHTQGCDLFQGFLISAPVPAEEFQTFLFKEKDARKSFFS